MERRVKIRLEFYMERNCLLNIFKACGTKNRSSVDQLIRLDHDMATAIAGSYQFVAVFLDIEKFST